MPSGRTRLSRATPARPPVSPHRSPTPDRVTAVPPDRPRGPPGRAAPTGGLDPGGEQSKRSRTLNEDAPCFADFRPARRRRSPGPAAGFATGPVGPGPGWTDRPRGFTRAADGRSADDADGRRSRREERLCREGTGPIVRRRHPDRRAVVGQPSGPTTPVPTRVARAHHDWTAHAPCQRDARTRVRPHAVYQPDAPARVRPPVRPPDPPARSARPIRPPHTSPARERRSGVAHRVRMRPDRTDRSGRPSLARRAGIEPTRQGARNPFAIRSEGGVAKAKAGQGGTAASASSSRLLEVVRARLDQ